jgi:hypothetical protein
MMWQADAASDRAYGRVDVVADVGESNADTWRVLNGFKGATWPSHGLPRGTVLLVVGLVI